MTEKLTPMMQQYYEIKSDYTDCILFFRLGDFYEMFGDDAIIGSKILDITLTSRDKGTNALPMCGIPYHSAESYIAKLNYHGNKVAICEQVSNANDSPGIVERKVTRVITPSTNLSDINLDSKSNQYLASLELDNSGVIFCLCDISTGELNYSSSLNLYDCLNTFSTQNVREILIKKTDYENPEIYKILNNYNFTITTANFDNDKNLFKKYFFNYDLDKKYLNVVNETLFFLEKLLKKDLINLNRICPLKNNNSFDLDKTTIQNLEIFYTNSDFDKKNSLLAVIDKTITSQGGRLLRKSLIKPLKNISLIQEKLDLVEYFYNYNFELSDLRKVLKNCYDLERLITKINLNLASPKEIKAVQLTLNQIDSLNIIIANAKLNIETESLNKIKVLLENALLEEVPTTKKDGNIFKDNYNQEILELRKLLNEGKDFILNLQKNEIDKTGISNLKISFNKVFGFYIEVSKGKTNLVPEYFIRKQTLTNCERYITPELKEYEEKVLTAEEKLKHLEEKLFDELQIEISTYSKHILLAAEKIANIDFLSAFAELARNHNYTKPIIKEVGNFLIKNGRHPVIEKIVDTGSFVPNDTEFSAKKIKLITGPNMGGKSTYLRQNAIICLLAQIGSYVPAEHAEITVCDQIFTRVGATDNLSKGQSTFMMEMQETAYILKNATKNSLLILDEIGRGTSTFDGVSIAWSILEFLANELNCKTLFATHYHELIEIAEKLNNCENLSVSVEDDNNSAPIFLHKIKKGAIDKSYGLHVAEMAGIPSKILARSNELIKNFETHEFVQPRLEFKKQELPLFDDRKQKSLRIKDELDKIDINQLTPLAALEKLNELKNIID